MAARRNATMAPMEPATNQAANPASDAVAMTRAASAAASMPVAAM